MSNCSNVFILRSNCEHSIIFSCWTRTLDLIERHLDVEMILFKRIDGDCPLLHRQRILDNFATNSEARVLLMTTGTGAFGYVRLQGLPSYKDLIHRLEVDFTH